jgi:hypothetical protein
VSGIGTGLGNSTVNLIECDFSFDWVISANGSNGPGIGPGAGGTVRNITISGGLVNAIGFGGAGIGAGPASTVDVILLDQCHLTTKGINAAGIGAGHAAEGNSNVRFILIRNGTVSTEAINGSGIGAGFGETSSSVVSEIVLLEVTVFKSHAVNGSGIGAGFALFGDSTVTNLSIINTVIQADGITGIGGGLSVEGTASLINLIITDSQITDAVGNIGAGIGSGTNTYSTVDNILISQTTVIASSENSAAIGGGEAQVNSLVIDGGSFTLTGTVGIGSILVITFLSSPVFFRCRSDPCFSGNEAHVITSSFTAITSGVRLFSSGFVGNTFSPQYLYGQYGPPSQQENFTSFLALQVGSVSCGSGKANITFTFSIDNQTQSQIIFQLSDNTGFIVSLPKTGIYTASDQDEELCFDGQSTLQIDGGLKFVNSIASCPPGLDVGKIVLVAVGVIGGIGLIYVGVICFLRYRRRPLKGVSEKNLSTAALLSEPSLLDSEIA